MTERVEIGKCDTPKEGVRVKEKEREKDRERERQTEPFSRPAGRTCDAVDLEGGAVPFGAEGVAQLCVHCAGVVCVRGRHLLHRSPWSRERRAAISIIRNTINAIKLNCAEAKLILIL